MRQKRELQSSLFARRPRNEIAQEECDLGGFDSPAKLISLITNLKKAVKNGDKAAVAALVGCPLMVKQGGAEREIANQAEFIKNYDAIMTSQYGTPC